MSTVLYITYDGLLDPLGMSQVWQYQKLLSKKHKIIIISYEKNHALKDKKKLARLEEEVFLNGVLWHKLTYHKKPSLVATIYDIVYGVIVATRLIKKHKIDFIHSRSYVPSIISLIINKITAIDYIFDMRGFWADEKIDGGAWKKNSFLYKAIKYIECKILANASLVVTLTEAGKSDVESLPCMNASDKLIQVIPTCANLKIFKPSIGNNCDKSNSFLLGYVGSVGTFYLFDEVLESFIALMKYKKHAKLLIINVGQHEYIKNILVSKNIDSKHVELKSVDYNEVPIEINRMDAGIFYIKPSFSKRSSSPTKLAEFLGCGKPCLINFGIGDTASVVQGENIGIVLKDFSKSEHTRGIIDLLGLMSDNELKERCIDVAHRYYSLEEGVSAYDSLYSILGGSPGHHAK